MYLKEPLKHQEQAVEEPKVGKTQLPAFEVKAIFKKCVVGNVSSARGAEGAKKRVKVNSSPFSR